MKVVFNPLFDERLENDARYVSAEYGPKEAHEFVESVLKKCHLLGLFPYMGRTLFEEDSGIKSEFRVLTTRLHFVIYRVTDDYVEIMSLLDARLDELSDIRNTIFSP